MIFSTGSSRGCRSPNYGIFRGFPFSFSEPRMIRALLSSLVRIEATASAYQPQLMEKYDTIVINWVSSRRFFPHPFLWCFSSIRLFTEESAGPIVWLVAPGHDPQSHGRSADAEGNQRGFGAGNCKKRVVFAIIQVFDFYFFHTCLLLGSGAACRTNNWRQWSWKETGSLYRMFSRLIDWLNVVIKFPSDLLFDWLIDWSSPKLFDAVIEKFDIKSACVLAGTAAGHFGENSQTQGGIGQERCMDYTVQSSSMSPCTLFLTRFDCFV